MDGLSSAHEGAWRDVNRANWDERVAAHLEAPSYDLSLHRSGRGRLHPIEERELGDVSGRRILHLQCHFGRDTLAIAQMGASVVGVDFSREAVGKASELARDLGLSERASFIEADVYAAPAVLGMAGSFDTVFVTWGALCWLPDLSAWAKVVAHFLKPGGFLYLADAHPFAMALEDVEGGSQGHPDLHLPYFQSGPIVEDDPTDYANKKVRLSNCRTYEWCHSLASIVTGIASAGLNLQWLHEHPEVPWRMFAGLVEAEGGMYHWPREQWVPLAFSLKASRPA